MKDGTFTSFFLQGFHFCLTCFAVFLKPHSSAKERAATISKSSNTLIRLLLTPGARSFTNSSS